MDIAPGGGALNKDTPDHPPSKPVVLLGGSDPPPSKHLLLLGGSDPPPSNTCQVLLGGHTTQTKIFSAPSARLNAAHHTKGVAKS